MRAHRSDVPVRGGLSGLRRALAAVAALPLLTAGCLLAAGGAAAGGGIYLTTRGAETIVQGSVEHVTGTVGQAFRSLGVEPTGQKDTDEGAREVYGRIDDGDVTVKLKRRTTNATRVEVRVRKSAVTWDKEMAKRILQEIQDRREGG